MKTKFLTIYGTRPQAMKIVNLDNHVLVNTGQHFDYEMSGIFEKELKLKPKYNLGKTEIGEMTDACIDVITKEDPDIVVVIGDTKSTLAGALAAKFCKKGLAHIEAGMRSYDMKQPEELVRVIVDRISDYRFCTTIYARQNLEKEGLGEGYVVGDALWDSLNDILPIPRSKDYEKYNVLTIHRPDNADSRAALQNILSAINDSKEEFIFPCHPRTKRNIKKFGLKIPRNIKMIKPLGYKEMIGLVTNCKKVLTDSGGLTREACWFFKPTIILRDTTEWQELVDSGWAVLVGSNYSMIAEALKDHNPNIYTHTTKFLPPFGAKEKIKAILYG